MLSKDQVKGICEEVLVDPVIQQYLIQENHIPFPVTDQSFQVTIGFKKGVMDATGLSVSHTIKILGVDVSEVKSSFSFIIKTNVSQDELTRAIKQFLVNDLIHDFMIKEINGSELPLPSHTSAISISTLSPTELIQLSNDKMLALNLEEMQRIQSYYSSKSREPTDIELETLAQTWSEHCVHKTFNGLISYNDVTIDSLLKTYIMKATEELNAEWCINVFSDNAGIIQFTDEVGLAVKVETHNHPTALDPYGGAGTGSGGVFRDAMGVGAKPIVSMDNLFFGSLDTPNTDLPKGVLHPKRLLKGSVAGIRDYGNKMGIPTANGSIGFHENYLGNPLVFAGVVGLLPLERYIRDPKPGDLIVLVGGRTGRDGIHGVTFASSTLTSESETIASSAVQIGNPLEQKRVLDGLIRARDHGKRPLYSAITDCGGGGLSSAVGEMGKDLGAEVNLDKIPLKYEGLLPWEIWVSESQERMILAVPPHNIEQLVEIFELENCEASVIGKFTNTKKLVLTFNGDIVCNLEMDFLHNGIPKISRQAKPIQLVEEHVDFPENENYTQDLMVILSHPSIASKEWIIRQYDHEVQANTVLKPLQGFDGHGNSCVIKPLTESWRGFVVSNGFNPNYSLNPKKMALSSIDEAIRNNICCGGRRFALLDNFSWGNPENEENLAALVEACQACYDSAVTLNAPFISGKDSLYNDFKTDKGETITIPHTLLITCIGIIPDIRKAVTSDFKHEGNHLYVIGDTKREMGGSMFYKLKNLNGGIIPDVNLEKSKQIFNKMVEIIDLGLICSCHDCSEGGLAVTLAEMCFGGNIGAEIDLTNIKTNLTKDYQLLFSESNSRFIVEVNDTTTFENKMNGVPFHKIGIIKGTRLIIYGLSGKKVVDESISELKKTWQNTFAW
ncbi:MAG: phosphoribosylformylglycinamidine synthase subunit PurL [Candidatus Hodarchaeota archaeon]